MSRLRQAVGGLLWLGLRYDEWGCRCYTRRSVLLLAYKVRHRLTGPRRGCSCTRCFHHPRRRVYGREIIDSNVRVSKAYQELHVLRKRVAALEVAARRNGARQGLS